MYDDMGMRFRNKAKKNVKLDIKNEDPFKSTTGHVPGGLPMISDSAFSLTILNYVSVAFLLVFSCFVGKPKEDPPTLLKIWRMQQLQKYPKSSLLHLHANNQN